MADIPPLPKGAVLDTAPPPSDLPPLPKGAVLDTGVGREPAPPRPRVVVSDQDMRQRINPFADPNAVFDPVSGVPMGAVPMAPKIGATLAATAGGTLQPIAGALQYAGIDKPAKMLKEASDAFKQIGGTPAKVGEFVGEVGSPLTTKAATLGGKLFTATPALSKSVLARSAGQGAGAAALTPTEPTDSYGEFLSEKAKQMGLGAGAGAVIGKGVQMAMAPQVSDKLQMLKDMGMKYFTPGQLAGQIPVVGKGLQATEQALTSLPITGMMIRGGIEKSEQDFNRAMGNNVLKPLGLELSKNVRPGNQMIDTLQNVIDDGYQQIEQKFVFQNMVNPKTRQSTFDFFIDKFKDVAQDKPLEHQKIILDELKNTILDPLQLKKVLSGAEFRIAEKNLGSKANAYMKDPKTQDIGFALRNLQESLRNELAIQNPAVGRELRSLHDAFKRYLRVERAAAYRGAQEGVFSPQQFAGATEALAGRRGAATGRGLLMPEAQAAESVMGRSMPSSGTAERLMTAGQASKMLGAGGAEVGAAMFAPEVMVPLALSGMLYNRPAMGALTKLATERPQFMRQMAPAATPAGAIAGGLSAAQNP